MEMIDAELRLGPPGSNSAVVVTVVQPTRTPASAAAKRRPESSVVKSEASGTDDHDDAAPASKVQVVGWPPVRAYRKNAFHAAAEARRATKGGEQQGSGLYVKVSMDGAPYLRKVDLRTYGGYRELRDALDTLFGCFSSSAAADGGCQFAIAYEDKDGDLMLAGDVPWEMFICSCKKLRIMRGPKQDKQATRMQEHVGCMHGGPADIWSNLCMREREREEEDLYIDHWVRMVLYKHEIEGVGSYTCCCMGRAWPGASPCMHASSCSTASQPGRPIHTAWRWRCGSRITAAYASRRPVIRWNGRMMRTVLWTPICK